MPVDRKPMRFAHSEGHTDVCYDENGDYLLTCGSDGDVRIYKDFDDSDPKSFRVGDHVTVLAVKNEKIVTASDNAVQAFTFPEGSPDGILTRFTAPVNHLCFNQSGTVLAAGSSDFNVKVVTIADGSQRLLKGHTAPVLSVTIDPKDQYIVSITLRGFHRKQFMVLNILVTNKFLCQFLVCSSFYTNDKIIKFSYIIKVMSIACITLTHTSCLTTLSILPKVNDARISKTMCRLSWQPMSGKYLAVPVDKGIKIYERNSWENIFNLDDGSHSELVSIVSWSPCGNYIASSSICGEIFIWKLSNKTVIERINHESKQAICGLVWNPRGNRELAYTDNQGQFGVCEGVISKEDEQEDGNNNIAASNHSMDDSLLATAVDGDSDDEQLIIAKKKQKKSNAWIDEEAEDDDDDDDEFKDIRKLKAVLAAPLDFGDGENDVDGDTASEVSAQQTAKKEVIHTPYVPTLQPAFQPSATPVHLMHRFMVWNSVGIVRCHKEDEISSIEVEFHDASTHHPLHLTNHLNHTMAALSSTALLLACKVQDDMTSKLVCIHFGSWDNSKEWTVEMPAEESIQTVAVGSSFVAVTTNKRFLRVFTIGGVQRHVFSLPGPVVCTSGRDCQLMVVYHLDNPIPGEQALAAKFLDLRENIITEERVTLSEKSTLSWVGFTENLTPVTVDSAGVVRMLSRSFGSSIWSPVCMTKSNMKNKSDNYWVVGLDEKNQQIRCIYCKGSSYPPTLPRPVLVLLPLQLPLCEMATEKGQLELACKSDREFRAVELCELLPDAHSVSLAIKYAALTRRMNLANRLDALARQKAGLETTEEFEDELPEPGPPIRQGHKRTQSNRPGRYCRTVSRPEQSGEEEEMEWKRMEWKIMDGMRKRRSLANLNNRDARSNHVVKQPRPPPSPAPSHSSSQGRSNPFRVVSQNDDFISTLSLFKAPEPKAGQKKKGKQTTLLKTQSRKEQQAADAITLSEEEQQSQKKSVKKNGFNLWYEENKESLLEAESALSDTELIKLAMRKWKSLGDGEKSEWNNKAKDTVNSRDDRDDLKKRKRKTCEDENEDTSNTLNVAKRKAKEISTGGTTTKLAGFVYKKD
ncbi:PREDICTED: WD repeat and HMG-box DNA-binding protein 1-like [Acropora digitifera]|uniref:WD repeat and HMG-box DNA-binding protein 1-like n=1 Tax=Acropora digitifera TaxID=70779 RepID=UPI00077A2D80|nr:PREDICTED: WD repeat and HMG-box DNA-binding protein 1-like [Acropora digitifera]